MKAEVINPATLGAPKGYSNGILAPEGGRLLFVAGQIAWNPAQQIVSEDLAAQFGQALDNVLAIVGAAGGQAEDIARLTIYVTDKQAYSHKTREIGEQYRARMGKHFPAMALLEVSGLLEPGAQVEIEATAVIPTHPRTSKGGQSG